MVLLTLLIGGGLWYLENVDTMAVVGIQTTLGSGSCRGTGFFVAKGVVATCCHVVFPQSPSDKIKDLLILKWTGDTIPVIGILGMDPRNDICLLSVADTTTAPMAMGNQNQARLAAAVVPYPWQKSGVMRPLRLEFLREETWSDGVRNLVVSAGPVPGYSGSPLLSDPIYGPNRVVVGMITATGMGGSAFVVEPEPINTLLAQSLGMPSVPHQEAFRAYRLDPAGLREMARCSWAMGNLQEAENCYILSLQRDPLNPTTHEEYASFLWTLARERGDQALFEMAEEHYRQAMQLRNDPRLHELIAFLYLEMDRYTEAGEELSRAAYLYEERGQEAKADSLRFRMKVVSSWGQLGKEGQLK
ncbi:MAG: tetratricopeptide repeat-containing S1 family peptidase [candidate division WOR-3 bacterium]